MAKPKPLTLAEVHDLIDRSAEYLGWTPKYVNLLATTATSVFVALGEPKSVPIDLELAEGQIDAVQSSLRERGKSAKTGGTYASAWRRIAAIIEGWQLAQASGEESGFWESFADNYRDPRLARRRIRRVPSSTIGASLVTSLADLAPTVKTPTSTYKVCLEHGMASLVLPDEFSSDDFVAVVDAVTRHRSKSG